MKRFSSLSALCVGLSLTSASVALAAPTTDTRPSTPPAVQAPGTEVQQPSSSSSTSSNATGGDSNGQSTPSTPAVTVGGSSTPGSDQPQTPAVEDKTQPPPAPFAGSVLFVQNSMTTNTVFRGQTQYYNPTVDSSLYILPRYAINKAFQLRARAVVSYEYTESDTTRYAHEPVLSDVGVSLYYRKIPKILSIQPSLAVNLALPTSKTSRARTLIAAPGATLQLARDFENTLGGDIVVLGSSTFTHPFFKSQQPEVVDDRPTGAIACVGGGSDCNNLSSGGVLNPANSLSYSAMVSGEWGKWNPVIYYMGATQWVYAPKQVNNPVDGRPVEAPPGFDPTTVRQTHYFSVWLDYNFNAWFTGEVGYWNARSALTDAGQRGNIIFDRYQDTRVYLGASIQLDNLVKALQGGNEGEAGVIRAQTQKRSIWNL